MSFHFISFRSTPFHFIPPGAITLRVGCATTQPLLYGNSGSYTGDRANGSSGNAEAIALCAGCANAPSLSALVEQMEPLSDSDDRQGVALR